MQKQKKHYWTQALSITIIVSCGLGIASGFQFSARNTIDPSRGCTNEMTWLEVLESLFAQPMKLYSEGEKTSERPAEVYKIPEPISALSTYGPLLSPLMQPGAILLQSNAEKVIQTSQSCATRGLAIQGVNLRMEPVPGAKPKIHRSSKGCTMDATPIAVALPIFVIGMLCLFRKVFFRIHRGNGVLHS